MDVLGPVDIKYLVFSSEVFALSPISPVSMLGYAGGALGGGLSKSPFLAWKAAGDCSMPKWLFPLLQSCGVLTAIRFVQIFLNQVRMAKYVGSPKIF